MPIVPERVAGAFAPGALSGAFRVEHGSGLLARLLARACRFPAPGPDRAVRLTIAANDGGSRWTRRFPDRELVTLQRELPSGEVAERMGLVECRFRIVETVSGARLEPTGASFCLLGLRIPLPRAVAPRIAAELTDLGAGAFRVTVRLDVPVAGRALAYDGVVTREASA